MNNLIAVYHFIVPFHQTQNQCFLCLPGEDKPFAMGWLLACRLSASNHMQGLLKQSQPVAGCLATHSLSQKLPLNSIWNSSLQLRNHLLQNDWCVWKITCFLCLNPLQNNRINSQESEKLLHSWQSKGGRSLLKNVLQTLFFLPRISAWLKINFIKWICAGVKSKAGGLADLLRTNFFQTSKRLKNGQSWKLSWNSSRKVFEKYWNSFQRSPHTPWFSHSQ